MARQMFATIIGFALTCISAEKLYSDKYDDIDVLSNLNNERLRMQYYKCFMDLKPCMTADAKFFKGMSNINYFSFLLIYLHKLLFIFLNIFIY